MHTEPPTNRSILNKQVSIGKLIYDSKNISLIKFSELVNKIKVDETIKTKVHQLRTSTSKSEKETIKKSLPWFTFNLFDGVRSNEKFISSQVLIFDLDHLDDFDEIRKELEKWIYTAAVFTSPSGDGLKLIVKINTPLLNSKIYTHIYSKIMSEIEKRFNLKLDTVTKDPARACFLSHDPNIYINDNAECYPVYISDDQQEVQSCSETRANKRDEILNLLSGVKEGERHNSLLREIAVLKSRGLDRDFIEKIAYATNKLNDPPLSPQEFMREFESIYNSLTQNDSVKRTFWNVVENDGRIKIIIDPSKIIDFLADNGFGKYELTRDEFIFIRSQNNILSIVSIANIKDFLQNYIQLLNNDYKDKIRTELIKTSNRYLSESTLEYLPTLKPKIKSGSKNVAYLFFINYFLKITPDNITYHKYSELMDEYVWSDSIINRKLDLSIYTSGEVDSEYDKLIRNICRNEKEWYNALTCTVGFMAHDFKDRSNSKAIIFCDEEIPTADDSNGGTGKSLVCSGLKYLRNTVFIDGKNLKTDSAFVFQKINVNTEVVIFDDVRKQFDFESLLSAITADLTVEKKNHQPITIPFEKSPKFIITTNYTINGNGYSFDRRKHEIEFSNHYSKDNTPKDEFGHILFDDWDADEWNRFYKTIAIYIQNYLKDGLLKYEAKNLSYRKSVNNTSLEFVDFMEDYVEIGKEYCKQDLLSEFKNRYPDYNYIKSRTFTNWLKVYAENNQLVMSPQRKSNAKRYFSLQQKNELDELILL